MLPGQEPGRAAQPGSAAEPGPRPDRPASPPPSYAPKRKVQAAPPPLPEPQPAIRSQRASSPAIAPPKRPRKRRSSFAVALTLLLLAIIAWPAFLLYWVNANLGRVDALVPGPTSTGTTYLLAGSDARDPESGSTVEGERADSIMLIRRAPGGQSSMVSLPRDLYVEIPGYGWNKINASYSFGGPQLLVETVQNLTGLQVDHYMEIKMQGFGALVDSVGGVELCMDMDVDDPLSGLVWQAGCHQSDGETALAFARMRYQDPRGDLGRAERQRDVIKAVTRKAMSPATLINPIRQWEMAQAGTKTLTVDQETRPLGIAKLLFTFRAATGSGLSGTPPLASVSETTDVGSVVLLDEAAAPQFFSDLAAGTLSKADFDTDF